MTDFTDDHLDPALHVADAIQQLEPLIQNESDNIKTNTKKKKKKKKEEYKSEMREAYKKWYYDEAYEFFNPYSSNQDLRKSCIHRDGKCKYLQKDDRKRSESPGTIYDGASDSDFEADESSDEERRSGGYLQRQGLGTVWTGKEKQIFFHHLARHSIHTLDHWAEEIPGKSKFEILTYYKVLQDNLVELKRLPTKKHGGVLGYEEFPIAYEVGDSWIELEEELSRDLHEEDDTNVIPTQDETTEDESSVINWTNWYKRWDTFYGKHRLLEYYPCSRNPNVFSPEAMQVMEILVKRYTAKLLSETIIPVLDKKSVPRALSQSSKILRESRTKKLRSVCKIYESPEEEHDKDIIEIKTSNEEFPHIVTENDVVNALVRMRLYSHSRGNGNDKLYLTYPESIVESIQKFDIELEKGKIFRNRKVLRQLRVLLYLQNSKVYSKQLTYPKITGKENIDWVSGNSAATYDTTSTRKRLKHDRDLADTPEYKKQKILDITIDNNDILRSAKYTHTLLTWLQLTKNSVKKGKSDTDNSAKLKERIHVTW